MRDKREKEKEREKKIGEEIRNEVTRAKNNRRDHCGNLEIRRRIKWQSFLVACMQTAPHFYDPCVFEFSPMERNEEHGVRLSTFDFTTDLKPLLGILSLYKQREEISNLCRNLHLAFEFPPLNSLELYFNAKFSSAKSRLNIYRGTGRSIVFQIFYFFFCKSFRIAKQDIRRAWLIERYYRLG